MSHKVNNILKRKQAVTGTIQYCLDVLPDKKTLLI